MASGITWGLGSGAWDVAYDEALQPDNDQYVAYYQGFERLAIRTRRLFFPVGRALDLSNVVTRCMQCPAMILNTLHTKGIHQQLAHGAIYSYLCGTCDKTFPTIYGRNMHWSNIHPGVPNRVNECPCDPSCLVVTTTSPPLPIHLLQNHLGCYWCCPYPHVAGSEKSPTHFSTLRSHIVKEHPGKSSAIADIIDLYIDPSTGLPFGATPENNFLQGMKVYARLPEN